MVAGKAKLLLLVFPIAMLVLYILCQFRQAEKPSTTKVLQKYRNVTSLMLTKTRQRTLLLLVYNEFFGNKKWINVDDDCSVPRTRKTPCRKDKFEVTYDKGRFYDSDFVLIHAASNLPSIEHLNEIWKQKPFGQLWIYFLMESPITSPDTSRFNGMFDLTFSYRTDSEFWFPYGTYEEIPFMNLSQHDFSIGKDKLVIWPVSNCRPPIRKLLVHELQKYITVDVYGRCSEQFGEARDCPRHTESCRIVTRHYKFLLAFENALCEDYITEKYWGHLGMLFWCVLNEKFLNSVQCRGCIDRENQIQSTSAADWLLTEKCSPEHCSYFLPLIYRKIYAWLC